MFGPAEIGEDDKVRLITRDEFLRMCHADVFDDDEHVELLRGVIVKMSQQGEPHARISAWLGTNLVRSLDETYEVRHHTSYLATNDSVPEPDVQVLERKLRTSLPRTSLLMIEVSQSSIRKDRAIKPPIYAENRCPEYWVVDIPAQIVWVYTQPTRGHYAKVESVDATGVLRPTQIPGVEIPVAKVPFWPPEVKPSKKKRKR